MLAGLGDGSGTTLVIKPLVPTRHLSFEPGDNEEVSDGEQRQPEAGRDIWTLTLSPQWALEEKV